MKNLIRLLGGLVIALGLVASAPAKAELFSSGTAVSVLGGFVSVNTQKYSAYPGYCGAGAYGSSTQVGVGNLFNLSTYNQGFGGGNCYGYGGYPYPYPPMYPPLYPPVYPPFPTPYLGLGMGGTHGGGFGYGYSYGYGGYGPHPYAYGYQPRGYRTFKEVIPFKEVVQTPQGTAVLSGRETIRAAQWY